MTWWGTQPDAWAYLQDNQQDPQLVMERFNAWVRQLPQPVAFVAFPVAFDFAWVNAYFHMFGIDNPFGYQGIDIKSYGMALLGRQFRYMNSDSWPKHWRPTNPFPHRALDDAYEQGLQFRAMLGDRARQGRVT